MPALFLFLPAPLAQSVGVVLGTNKLSSMCGTAVALQQYVRRIPINWRSILPSGLAAFVLAFVGAAAVSLIRSEVLKPIILILLILVAVYTFVRKDFGNLHAPHFSADQERLWGVFVGAGIGFYDGFFGPGTGSFLMFIFISLFGFDFLTATASAKVLNVATNLAAVIYFAASDRILYRYALPMGGCNVLGALVGARLAILKGNAFVRLFFLVLVTMMICRFGYEILFR